MKTILKTIFSVAYCLILMGCNNDNGKIWDVYPVNIDIQVVDGQGNSLLIESNPSNILDNDIKVIYKGVEYPLGVNMSTQNAQTRYYLAVLDGLKLISYNQGDQPYLSFGEFSGDEDWNETMVISWGDGTSDEIRLVHDYEFKKEPTFVVSDRYLNGKLVDERTLVIVK